MDTTTTSFNEAARSRARKQNIVLQAKLDELASMRPRARARGNVQPLAFLTGFLTLQ